MNPRQLAARLALQLLIRVSGLASGLVTVALLARGMDRADFGRFSTCLTVVTLAGALSDLGLTTAAVRDLAARPTECAVISRALLYARLGTSSAALAIALVASVATFGWQSFWWPSLPVLATLALIPLSTGQALAQAQLRLGAQNAILLVQAWLWPIGVIVVFVIHASPTYYAIAFFLAAAVCGLLALRVYGSGLAGRPAGLRREVRRLISVAAPYAVSGFFVTAYYRLGGLILFRLGGATEAADFAAGFKVIDALQTLPAALLTVVFPLMSRALGTTRRPAGEAQQVFALAARCALLAGVPVALGGSLLSSRIVHLLYGSGYAHGAHLFSILMLAYPAICLGWILTSSIVSTGDTRPLIPITGTVAAVNVGASLLLIPEFGAVAASAITTTTEVVIAIALSTLLYRRHKLRLPITDIARITAAGLVMVAVLAPIRHTSLALSIPSGVAMYMVAVLAFGAVRRSDWDLLRHRRDVAGSGASA
jgi:O-antigen/teichoic acid export membrane protein